MIFVILAIWMGYKKGRDSGRSGALWAVISGVVFIGVQLLVGVGIGMLWMIGLVMFGWSEKALTDYSIVISLIAVVPAIGAILLIFKYLDRIPDEPVMTAPPPPPTFSQYGPRDEGEVSGQPTPQPGQSDLRE